MAFVKLTLSHRSSVDVFLNPCGVYLLIRSCFQESLNVLHQLSQEGSTHVALFSWLQIEKKYCIQTEEVTSCDHTNCRGLNMLYLWTR